VEIRYGLVSSDSHANLHKDAFLERMSAVAWGDRIPQVREVEQDGSLVERWVVHGKPVSRRGVANCAAAMGDPLRRTYPQRWEEVPPTVYDPAKRLQALDADRVDGEVLFFNDPVDSATLPFQGEPEFELACVRAYNDALAQWRQVSDRYVPIALIPYLSPMETIVAEVRDAVKQGHGGIVMFAEPSMALKGIKHSNDPYWDPLWATCEELDIPIHWHGSAGLPLYVLPHWDGFTGRQLHTATTARLCATPTQAIPNLYFSRRMERFPGLKWVCAETGMGWINFVLESCDHEWEQRHLWTEGFHTRPSDAFRRQIVVDFWFEQSGVELRNTIGVDNIMWESDYPHITSTYPNSKEAVERAVAGVPREDREKMLYGTAVKLYKLN